MAAGGIEHTLLVTEIVNWAVGQPIAAVLDFLGLPYPHEEPVPGHVVVSGLIVGLLLWFGTTVHRRLKEVPDHWTQHVAELFMGFIHGLVDEMIGHKGRRFQPIVATLGIYIFMANQVGLLPFMASPTASLNTTLALALIVFLYYNWHGVKAQGVIHYLRHFAGPELPLWMLPINVLIFFIEIISNFARILSLSVRLFGNIFGGDMVVIIFFMLVPYFVPLPMMIFSVIHGGLQAFVFIMLTVLYIAAAVAEEEH